MYEVQRRSVSDPDYDDLRAEVAANGVAITALQTRAEEANHRADSSDAREVAQDTRIDDIQDQVDVHRVMITELHADGLVSTKHAAELELALRTSRDIGTAIGIVMAMQKVDAKSAFETLCKASQDTNIKLRILAEHVVRTGAVSQRTPA